MKTTQLSLFNDQPLYAVTSAKDSMLSKIDCTLAHAQVYEHATDESFRYVEFPINFYKMDVPAEGTTVHVMSNGAINLTSYIIWLQKKHKSLKRVFVSAWSFGFKDMWAIENLCRRGLISQLDVLCSDQHSKRHPNEHQFMLKMQQEGLIKGYWRAPIHSKLVLAETHEGHFYVVNSAANCTMRAQIEIAEVTNSRDLYDMYNEMFSHMDCFVIPSSELNTSFNKEQYEQEEEHTVLYGD